jgi:hypothetical protein
LECNVLIATLAGEYMQSSYNRCFS